MRRRSPSLWRKQRRSVIRSSLFACDLLPLSHSSQPFRDPVTSHPLPPDPPLPIRHRRPPDQRLPCSMASQEPGPDEEQSLRECEAYVQRHNIQQLLRDCIVQVSEFTDTAPSGLCDSLSSPPLPLLFAEQCQNSCALQGLRIRSFSSGSTFSDWKK